MQCCNCKTELSEENRAATFLPLCVRVFGWRGISSHIFGVGGYFWTFVSKPMVVDG